MKEDFIIFFATIARQKLNFKYSIVNMILHTFPHLKDNWKKYVIKDNNLLPQLMKEYPHLDTREYRFILFIANDNISATEMEEIILLHRKLDFDNLNPEFAFTEEELQHYYNELFNSVKSMG